VDEKGRLLIDGGESEHSLLQLQQTISKIQAEYDLPTEDGNQLKFDAILITHWDLDHWFGVHQLLQQDLETTLRASEGYQPLIDDSNASWRKSIVKYQFTNITPEPVTLEALTTQTEFDAAYTALALTPEQKVEYTDALLAMGPEAILEAPWNLVDTCFSDVVVRSKYLKYGADYPAAPRFVLGTATEKTVAPVGQDQLLTSFYVPYQSEAGKLGPPPSAEGLASTRAKGTFFSSNANGDYVLKADRGVSSVSNQNWLTILMASSYQLKVPDVQKLDSGNLSAAATNVEPTYVKDWRLLYCCKLYADFEDYLGAEIFYGTNGTSVWRTWKNPAGLLKDVNLSPVAGPRMFIVAGDQMVIGETPLVQASRATKVETRINKFTDAEKMKLDTDRTKSNTGKEIVATEGHSITHQSFSHPFSRIIDTYSQGHLGVRYTGNFRETSDDRNSASLVCVILSSTVSDWTTITTTDQERNSFQALYYTGGDALYDEEGAVASWLRNPAAPWDLLPLPAMKLSQ
jgi:glyoxylase-like metal-dependent hydrolase (beta-lactamase superfamily II)